MYSGQGNKLGSLHESYTGSATPKVGKLEFVPFSELMGVGAGAGDEGIEELEEELKASERLCRRPWRQAITEKMRKIENNTYHFEVGTDPHQYLQALLFTSDVGSIMKNEIQQTLQFSQHTVEKDINKKYGIHQKSPMTKDHLKELEAVDRYRMLKIKNGQIRNKVGYLREQLQHQYYLNKKKRQMQIPLAQIVRVSDYYSLNNPKTKEANEFVKEIQYRRKQERKKYNNYLIMKKYQEERQKQEEKLMQEQYKRKRKAMLEQAFREKHEYLQQQREQQKRHQEQAEKWVKELQNNQEPLFIRKADEFVEQKLIPQLKQRNEKIKEKKMENRPLDFESIDGHEKRYFQFKKDDQIRKQAYLQMIRQQNHENQDSIDQLYKGEHRYNVLAQMVEKKKEAEDDPHLISRVKKARQIVYGDQIKDKMEKLRKSTAVSQKTGNTLKRRERNRSGTMSITNEIKEENETIHDAKADGKAYLKFIKDLVQVKGKKKAKKSIQVSNQKNRYHNYLHDLHQQREFQSIETMPSQKKVEVSIPSLKAQADNFSERIKRNEVRKKYNVLNPNEDADVEKEEINAAKLKLQLINNID